MSVVTAICSSGACPVCNPSIGSAFGAFAITGVGIAGTTVAAKYKQVKSFVKNKIKGETKEDATSGKCCGNNT